MTISRLGATLSHPLSHLLTKPQPAFLQSTTFLHQPKESRAVTEEVTQRVSMTPAEFQAAEKALEQHPTWGLNMRAATTQKERERLVFALVVRLGLEAVRA